MKVASIPRELRVLFVASLLVSGIALLLPPSESLGVGQALAGVFVLFSLYVLRSYPLMERLLLVLIILMPLSYATMFAFSISGFSLNYFNIILLILAGYLLLKRQFPLKASYPLLLFLIFASFAVMSAHFQADALKQLVSISLYLLAFPIGVAVGKYSSVTNFSAMLLRFYIISVVVFAVTILFQALYIELSDDIVGGYLAKSSRVSFGGLMQDFSYASVYLASGVVALFATGKALYNSRLLTIIAALIMASALFATQARAGLLAMGGAAVLWGVCKVVKEGKRGVYIAAAALLVVLLFGSVLYMARGSETADLGNSWRQKEYSVALETFKDNPVLGSGIGIENYVRHIYITYGLVEHGYAIPHNLILQYLAQFGLLGTLIVLSGYVLLWKLRSYRDLGFFLPFFATLVGAMVIPDIFNVRFFFILTVIVIAGSSAFSGRPSGAVNEQ